MYINTSTPTVEKIGTCNKELKRSNRNGEGDLCMWSPQFVN